MLFSFLVALSTLFIQTPQECVKINAHIAVTDQERERGLQEVSDLPEEVGMLFVFEESGRYPFWMDKTPIPLACLFLDENFKVVDIKKGIPFSQNNFTSSVPFRYVLEVNPILVLRHQITNGCTVLIEEKTWLSSLEKKS